MKFSKVLFITFFFFAVQIHAKKIYVNDNSTTGDIYTSAVGSATNTGLTSGSPKLTLAQGLTISVNGDTILVDKGNYTSTTNVINVEITIIGAGSGNTIFTGNATVNRFGTISVSNVKIMNMNFINYYLNQEGQVLLINSNLTGIVFENVVIRKNPGTNTAGANVLVSSGSNVIFNNCAFSCSGWNADYGGAIYVDNSTVAVNNCLFIDNKNFVRYGGAIYMYGANPNVTIQNTTFSKCSARRGGAIYQNSGLLTVNGCCFLNNFSAGDASDPNNGGGAFCQFAGTSKFTNCQFNNNYNSQGADPNNASVDGGAILFRGATGTFSFNTCSFANNIPYDSGADFYLDKTSPLTGTITNCTFTTAPAGEVNIRNFDMATSDVVLANSGTPSFVGTVFTASGCNTLLPTSTPTAQCKNTTIAGCGSAINCATEALPPLIITCVPNKTLTGCSGILGNYIPEVVAFDDCAFTISQNPLAGTVITAITQVTMTVTDQAGNNSICTFYVTPGSGGVTLSASATTSITCFGAATGSATVTPSGGAGTYTVTWMPGSLLGLSQTGLIANNYTVTANDGVCNTTIIVPINQPLSPITISLTATSYSICPNNTITLSPTGANSYTLNPGNLSNTNFSLSPTSTTTYTITGSNINGCLSANTITTTITVNATPTVGLASVTSPTICSGNSTTITASGANSYTLSSATQTLTTNPFAVNPTATTTYTLKGNSNAGCLSANTITTTITVNATPTVALASVSSPTICSGNSTTITASGANSYTLSSATQTLTTNPFVVNPTSTTTYTLKGISNLGCLSANTITTTITVNATPTVALASVSSPTICSGNSTTITASGANSYTLSSTTQTLTTNPFVVNSTSTTTYTIIGISTAGCLSANTITTTITVNPTPTVALASVSSPTICSGNTTTITASGAISYTLSSTTQTLTTNPFVVNPTTTTTYTLKGIGNLGCLSANTITTTINVNATPTVALASVSSPTICSGNSTTITASGANSFTLSSTTQTLTTNPFVANPIATTTYTLKGISNLGCLSANTITTTITVNATPTVALASVSSPTICSGNSTTITASGANSYTLSSTTQTLTTNPFVVNSTSTTTYTIIGISTAGCLSANTITTTITVNPTPTVALASVSSPTICSGNSTTITANGANNYTLSSATQTLTTNPFVVNPTTTTTYSLIGTSNAGCLSANTITTTITVNATPTVAIASISSPTICSGNSTTITASGANSYTLSSTTQTLTTNPFVVNPIATTTYTLKGISNLGCLSANTITTTITVNPTPTVALASVSSPTICSGNSTTITASGANSYTLSSSTQTLTTNPFVVNPTTTTNYSVIGISTAGCLSANTITTTITVNATPTLALPSSETTLCTGNPLILNVSASGNVFWTGPNSYTSTATNPTVTIAATILQAGTYSVTTSSVYGSQVCTSAVEHYSVSIVTSVNILVASSNLCAGSTATISPTGASTYTLISNLSSNTGISFTVSPTVNTTYTVLGTAGTGCNGTSIFTININPLPILAIYATNTVLCSNQNATLTVSGTDTYTWNSTGLTVNASTLTINPLSNTNYSVTGTNTLTGCQTTSIIPIIVNSTPTVNITSSTTNICKGDSITINLFGASSYTISSPTIITNSIAVISPSVTSTYTIIGTSSESCNSLPQTLSINVNDLPIISASNQTNCAGNTVTLSVSGANSYTWNPIGIIGNSLVVSPIITTNYSVIGTNTLTGCLSLETNVTVFTLTLPTATINANPTTICTTDNVNLVGTSTSTNVIYNWSLGNGITPSNQNLSTINFPANSLITGNYIYTLTVTSIEGCVSLPITSTISIISTPNSEFNLSDLELCLNDSNNISINIAQAGVLYNWTIGGIEILNSNSIIIPSSITNNAGTYTVTVTASIGTCSNSAINTLTINSLPIVNVINPNIIVCENTSINLEVLNPISTSSYLWNINNLSPISGISVNLNPINILNTGTYSVSVIDENGCRNGNIGTINIKTCDLFIPEMFTPNGDGKNDGFIISGLENYPNSNLSIYNRWGNKVYQKDKYDNEFTGYPNVGNTLGKDKLPVGTYYIIIDFGDKTMKNYSGILQLQY